MTRMIQEVKWFLNKNLEALIAAERLRARSFRNAIEIRLSTTNQINQFLICHTDEMKAVAQKLGHPIVFLSQSHSPRFFMLWILKPKTNDIISEAVLLDLERDEVLQTYCDNHSSEKSNGWVAIINALREYQENQNPQRTFQTSNNNDQALKTNKDYQYFF